MMTINSPAGLFVVFLMYGAICKKPVLCEETSWLQRMLRPLGLLHDPGTSHNDLESSLDLQHLTLLWGIPDTEAHIGSLFKFTIPENAFQGSVQSYQVKAAGAHVLPHWLSFNESQRSFFGVPSSLELGPCAIEVTAIQQDIRVTTHFIIKVTSRTDHMALWSFTSDSPQPLQIIQDSPFESKPLCNWDQNLIKATLILDVTFSDLTATERVTILQQMSSFLTRDVRVIQLIPKRHETINKLLKNEILVAGPGNVERGPTSDGTELSWVVGCQTRTKVNDLANVMEHNVQGGRFTSELKRNIIGWYVSGIQPPEELRKLSRKRRAVVINPTLLATPSVSVVPSSLAIIPTSTIDRTNSIYEARSLAPEASDNAKNSKFSMSQTVMSPTASISSSYSADIDWSTSSTEESMSVSLSSVVTPSLPIMTESLSPFTGASMLSHEQDDSVTSSPSTHESAIFPSSTSRIVQPSYDKNVSELHKTTNSALLPSEIYNNSIQPTETPLESSAWISSVADSPSTFPVPDSSDNWFSSDLLPSFASHIIVPSKTEVYESTAVSQLHSAETTPEIMSSDRFYSTSTPLLPSSIIGSQGLQPSYVLPESSNILADSSHGFEDSGLHSSLLSAGSSSLDLGFNSAQSSAIYTPLISQSMDLSSSMPVVSSFAISQIEYPFRTSVHGSELPGSISTVQLHESSALLPDSDLLQSSNNLDYSSQQIHSSPTSQLFESSNMYDSTFTSANPTVSVHASSVLVLDTDLVDSTAHFSISSQQELLTATPFLPDSSVASFPIYETVTPTLNTSTSSLPYSETELVFHSNETEQVSSPGSSIFPSSQESSIVSFQSTSEPTTTLESDISTSLNENLVTMPLPIDSMTQASQGSISTTVDEYDTSVTSLYVFDGMSTTTETIKASGESKSEVFLYPTSTVYQSTSVATSHSEWTESEVFQTELPQQSRLIYSGLHSEILPLTTDLHLDPTGLVFESSVPSAMTVSPTKLTTVTPSISEASEPLSSELWTLQTTESDSTSLASVTEETKFSTTETPRLPIKTTESPKGPVLVKPLEQLYVQVGRYFEYHVPPNTFSVGFNVATETLRLKLLSYDASPLPSDSWLLFDQHKHVIYGLPTTDKENNTHAYLLSATDSSNRKAVGHVVIRVEGFDLDQPSHRFNLSIDYDFKEFQRSIKNLINLVQLLSAFYDDSTPDNLTVMSVAQGSVVLSWMNNSLSHAVCERDRITSLYKMIYNGGVTSSLREHLYPFVPIRATLDYLGVCAIKDSEKSSDTSIFLVSILVPLFILFIGLFLLICFCHYCRSKKKHQGKVYLDSDAPVFAANRKPVVMEGELELHEMRRGLHAKPVQMARDFDDFFEPSFYPESPIKSPPPYHMQGADNFAFESDNISSNRSSPPEYKSQRSSPNISPPLYRLPPPYKFV